jgi:cbb3-type cytochrome c oxidase subunit III
VQAADRGAELFNGLCNRCHGHQGQGIVGLQAPLIAGMPAWYIEGQMEKFQQGLRGRHPKDGPGMRMRPMAKTVRKSDVPAVAAYVAQLPSQQSAATVEGDLEKGKAGFALCASCHGPAGKGNQALKAPPLAGQSDWYLLTQLKNFKTGRRAGPVWIPDETPGTPPQQGSLAQDLDASGVMMRNMVLALDEEMMANIVTYIQTLSDH